MQEERDSAAGVADPSSAVRDQAHLIELLLAGLNSPIQEATDEIWERKRQEVYRRHTSHSLQA